MKKQDLRKIIKEELNNIRSEADLIKTNEFNIEKLNLADLDEYDMVLDDILNLIKKYRWIPGIEKGIIAKQAAHDKKLVSDKTKAIKAQGAINRAGIAGKSA